jgi:2-oxoglutarate dehydrogenase E2 component (dihydrolipoamide succinyltransferase)
MSTELKIPEVGESIQEVQIGHWLKKEGDQIQQDENVVELETDKASVDLPAPSAGRISKILKHDGELVAVGETIALIEESNGKPTQPTTSAEEKRPKAETGTASETPAETPAEARSESPEEVPREEDPAVPSDAEMERVPSNRHQEESSTHEAKSEGDKQQGRSIKQEEQAQPQDEVREASQVGETIQTKVTAESESPEQSELEELVPMSLIRRRISARLVEAQQRAALLTTFNEIDMSNVIALRKRCQQWFKERYDIKLGFMSFFVKAAVDALKQFPEINAEIQETSILYRNYYHIGIAIGSRKGLVVPVLRYAERMSFAEIEAAIADFADRADKNKITPDELQNGTFTISNGGVYGSLLSTPIVNPPQSGVLGMHAIEDRPIAIEGEVVVRPMMYVALTYDHRIVDGAEAVSFLRRIKEAIEEPARMLIEV